jgi:dephospho-CoA kinase
MASPPSHAAADADDDDDARPSTLGITGSIGMGKSAVAAMLARLSVPVLDADAVVHALYAPGGAAVAPIAARFGGGSVLTAEGGVCRQALSRAVLGGADGGAGGGGGDAMRDLEAIVHPLVALERAAFLQRCAGEGHRLAALDIPLLFETGAEAALDAVAVASCPAEQQRARVLARPGMTEEKLGSILARQLPDADKRARADFVLDTGAALAETERAVAVLVRGLREGRVVAAAAAAAGAGGGADGAGPWRHPEAGALLVVRAWRLEERRARARER